MSLPRALLQFLQIERRVQRIQEGHAFDSAPGREIFAQDNWNLVEPGNRPDLRIIKSKPVVSHATNCLQHHRSCNGKHGKRQQIAFDVSQQLVRRDR